MSFSLRLKKAVFAAVLITQAIFSFAYNFSAHGFHFDAAPVYSVSNGLITELVLDTDDNGEPYTLSELLWQFDNVQCFGFDASFGWKFLNLRVKGNFPVYSVPSVMYDSDWQNSSDHSMKTNYSISENTLRFDDDLSFTGEIQTFSKTIGNGFSFTVTGLLGLDYDYCKFEARNGYGWYGDSVTVAYCLEHENFRIKNPDEVTPGDSLSYDDENAAYFDKGELSGIDYTRETYTVFLGVELKASYKKNFFFKGSASFAPYSKIASLDLHYGGSSYLDSYYYDEMRGNVSAVKLSAEAEYRFPFGLGLGMSYSYRNQTRIEGESYLAHSPDDLFFPLSSYSGSADYKSRFSLFARYSY